MGRLKLFKHYKALKVEELGLMDNELDIESIKCVNTLAKTEYTYQWNNRVRVDVSINIVIIVLILILTCLFSLVNFIYEYLDTYNLILYILLSINVLFSILGIICCLLAYFPRMHYAFRTPEDYYEEFFMRSQHEEYNANNYLVKVEFYNYRRIIYYLRYYNKLKYRYLKISIILCAFSLVVLLLVACKIFLGI